MRRFLEANEFESSLEGNTANDTYGFINFIYQQLNEEAPEAKKMIRYCNSQTLKMTFHKNALY